MGYGSVLGVSPRQSLGTAGLKMLRGGGSNRIEVEGEKISFSDEEHVSRIIWCSQSANT